MRKSLSLSCLFNLWFSLLCVCVQLKTVGYTLATIEEVNRLLKELPSHLKDMVAFTLTTGLRASNVTGLEWQPVDLIRRKPLIHADQAKTNKAFSVPLNDDAINILKCRLGTHPRVVFTYQNNSIGQCNKRAWSNALKRAGIGKDPLVNLME